MSNPLLSLMVVASYASMASSQPPEDTCPKQSHKAGNSLYTDKELSDWSDGLKKTDSCVVTDLAISRVSISSIANNDPSHLTQRCYEVHKDLKQCNESYERCHQNAFNRINDAIKSSLKKDPESRTIHKLHRLALTRRSQLGCRSPNFHSLCSVHYKKNHHKTTHR